jgi:hypothetical protein
MTDALLIYKRDSLANLAKLADFLGNDLAAQFRDNPAEHAKRKAELDKTIAEMRAGIERFQP